MSDLYYKYRWLPPFVLLIVILGLPYFIEETYSDYKLLQNIFAISILIISVVIRSWSRMYIGKHTRESKIRAPKLVQQGPYSCSRNPLYLSNILAGVAIAGFQNIITSVFAGIVLSIHYMIVAKIEERYLRKEFKNEYSQWANETPFCIISMVKILAAIKQYNHADRSFLNAFVLDKWTWIWQSIAIALVLGLNL